MTRDIIPDPRTIPIEHWSAATIIPSADGTWEPTAEQPGNEGIDASLLQIEERDGSLYDVVAWQTMGAPGKWWTRYGRATYLGEWSIDLANREQKPVWLCGTPRAYLKHVPLAVCILDWRADVRAILLQVEYGIICTSPALEARARRAIDRPSDRVIISRRVAA